MTGRTVWFNCCAGVAGDMLLAALVDAGADVNAIADGLTGLGVDGYALAFERVQRCGVAATWTHVAVHDALHDNGDDAPHAHRPARDVLEMIGAADLSDRVRERSLAVYRALADVEGEIHGVDAGDVELHEVGALDSIVDVVGVCVALEVLGVDSVVCSPIAVGHGTVRTAHGELPNPVPAVTALLARAGAPAVGIDTTMETATPTGVALMTVLAERFGAMPSIAVTATGFGAGTADPPARPNVVQAVIGDSGSEAAVSGTGRPARLLEANVDDVTGEVLAHTIAALIAAGAYDAWATPIVMKKGRPAHTVHALCDDATLAAVSDVMIVETGTLGVRATAVERWPQRREERFVDVGGHPVRVKVSGSRVKAEHDDAVAAAAFLRIPLREVLRRAETADDDRSSST
ncbi:MAG TPA: nickel pincer cofactor biosynthesis protein LarC [Ilumatobacteraceae bacterium]|nr:nickel pincer cofactor biosynthesis protein LarC [Ilumatobacteraceae bacterium]